MRSTKALVLLLVSVAACGDPGGGPGAGSDAAAPPDAAAPASDLSAAVDAAAPQDLARAADPLALAAEVKEAELKRSITELEGFGSRYTFGPGDELARDYLVQRLADHGFKAELDEFMVNGTVAANVIAKKPGAEKPDVVFIFSAHYDSTSSSPMQNAPGADDNASGVAAVLEAARVLSARTFSHSLWFVFTAAEEQGSKGSQHMAGWLKAQRVGVRGVIAPDMIAYWPLGENDSLDILGDPDSQHLVAQMAGVADALGVKHKDWIRHDYCYGDDHTMFQEAGFPSISPMDCVEAHNVPASREKTPHYHQITDRLNTLHLPFATKVTSVIVATFAQMGGLLK